MPSSSPNSFPEAFLSIPASELPQDSNVTPSNDNVRMTDKSTQHPFTDPITASDIACVKSAETFDTEELPGNDLNPAKRPGSSTAPNHNSQSS